MELIRGEGRVFQGKDGVYLQVHGFPGQGSYKAAVFRLGTIAGEEVFVPEFQLRSGAGKQLIVVSEEQLNNPTLFTEIGVPGFGGVPGVYPVHLY